MITASFLQRFWGQAWYLTESAWEALAAMALRAEAEAQSGRGGPGGLGGRDVLTERTMARRPVKDVNGDEFAALQMVGKVAVVPIHGTLMKGATGSDKFYCRLCAHEDVREDLDAAVAGGARAVVLDVASPGGSVAGTQELAERVANLRAAGMPVYSYAGQFSASAAEYITAACTSRLAAPSATVGSIGTMAGVMTFEQMLNKMGIEFNLIASGKFKGMGHPAKSLTPAQRNWMQDFVNSRAQEFKDWMGRHRPGMKAESMEGQVFTGREAVKVGLIDGTVNSLEEMVALVNEDWG